MAKHCGESSKLGQAGPLPQSAADGLQVQTRSQVVGAAHEKHDIKQDEREVGYSLRVEEAQSGALTGKRSHKERLTTVETRLDVLEASLFDYSTTVVESSWEPRSVLQPEQKNEDSAKDEEMQRLQRF
ncbi:hypothetical protein BHE74_00022911 [Ensete ventricosum]|nr:hypothetical protein BHE74_00022911 [Ensete ventricosum]RZR77782.1 hypothetical protein BHM03_00002972 [Ensete ventricosum]